ncbi:MAG: LysR family transcriptional regulator [Anaerolineae bacterium]|nr:LysR family transcriptional regulator [Anaerolineae bacterium]
MAYPSFELYKLRIFVLAVESGSLSAAAERMYMTQPAISQHIQELEAALGATLLNRSHRGVTLTEAGKTFYQYAQRILALAEEAEQAIRAGQSDRSTLSIAATPGVSTYLLPRWLVSFRAGHPQVAISTQTATTPEIITAITEHQVTLGIIEGELDEKDEALFVRVLGEASQQVVVGRGHPFWGREAIPWAELHGALFIMRQPGSQTRIWLEGIFRSYGVQPCVIAEFDSPEAIKRLVMSGNAMSILPEYAVREEVALGRLQAIELVPPLRRTLRAVWSRAHPLPALADAFLCHVLSQPLASRADS